MSLAVSPFNVFRSCRASVASRNLSRSAFSSSQTRRIGTRRFLSTSPQGEPDQNAEKPDPSAEVDPCANVKNSLKAKEAEVLDLTVRI